MTKNENKKDSKYSENQKKQASSNEKEYNKDSMLDEIKNLYGFSPIQPQPSEPNVIFLNINNLGMNWSELKEVLHQEGISSDPCPKSSQFEPNEQCIKLFIGNHDLNLRIIDILKKIVNIGGMHPKGVKLINDAIQKGDLMGLDTKCPYYPCHEGLEDCTFCYCPFYPCGITAKGGKYITNYKTGEKIWDCTDCLLTQKKNNAKMVLDELIICKKPFQEITRKKLIKIQKKVINSHEK